jgi:hypothetical protein
MYPDPRAYIPPAVPEYINRYGEISGLAKLMIGLEPV